MPGSFDGSSFNLLRNLGGDLISQASVFPSVKGGQWSCLSHRARWSQFSKLLACAVPGGAALRGPQLPSPVIQTRWTRNDLSKFTAA